MDLSIFGYHLGLVLAFYECYTVWGRATSNLTPTYRTYLWYDPRLSAANNAFVLPRPPAGSPPERYLSMIMKILTN